MNAKTRMVMRQVRRQLARAGTVGRRGARAVDIREVEEVVAVPMVDGWIRELLETGAEVSRQILRAAGHRGAI